ncbi:hypothetical protein IAD21_02246 [Abditibacteriota bacterium]|nr:hypothetical protein IAD21_02246 [Abditibacteriota bacterium]
MPRALLIEFQTLPSILPKDARTILQEVPTQARSYLKWKEHREKSG